MWQHLWDEFVDGLDDEEALSLFRKMGLSIPGFRRGSQNLSRAKGAIRSVLKSAPARRGGAPFLKWFRKQFADLVTDLETLSDEELEDRRDDYWERFPARIVAIALAMFRSELLEAWSDAVEEAVAKQLEKQLQDKSADLEAQVESLRSQLAACRKELEQSRKREDGAVNTAQRLTDQVERLSGELQEVRDRARQETAALQAELEALQKEKDRLGAEQTEWKERSAEQDKTIAEQREQIEGFQARIHHYRRQRRHNISLFRLYRSLSGFGEAFRDEDERLRVLVIGDDFPEQHFHLDRGRIEAAAVAAPETIDDDFVALCRSFDRVLLLSTCPHPIRLGVYERLGRLITDISTLDDFAAAIFDEEREA